MARIWVYTSLLIVLTLVGCSATGPRLVGLAAVPTPIVVYPYTNDFCPQRDLYIEIRVQDYATALEELSTQAYRRGAQEIRWRSWQDADGTVSWGEIEYSIPSVEQAYSLGSVVSRMGRVERRSEMSCSRPFSGPAVLTVLVIEDSTWPLIAGGRFGTLQRAWRVTRGIFGFLLDGLIWIVVVAGPLFLLMWSAWKLFKRWIVRRA